MEEFIRSTFGLAFIIRFMNDWAASSDVPQDFELFYYEKLSSNTLSELRRFCEWCGVDSGIDDSVYEFAVAQCSFERMQQWDRDIASHLIGRRLDTSVLDNLHVRSGKVGGHRDRVDGNTRNWMDSFIKKNLNPIYYKNLWEGLG
jgi:hypothetical protein